MTAVAYYAALFSDVLRYVIGAGLVFVMAGG